MHHTNADLSLLLAETDAAAARLRRRLHLPAHQEDDLRQELLADLIRRLPAFNPSRGSLGAFAGVVVRNQASRIADRIVRERRAAGGPLLSLDTTLDAGRPLGERLVAEVAPGAEHPTVIERRLDLAAMITGLDTRDRALCIAVAHWSIEALVSSGFGSRAGLYRRLRELRCRLTARGFRAA